ncbi:MAG: NAD(P)/FAD-dependent oxidoreductase, partial [Alicyclobacillus sp.]|nr:NAD(P)/FAD-dependent oxidoreductase [Alicyclobacillus sp.]
MLDAVIVGGGIAGLQAAIQLGRYNRSILILDANTGRSTLCRQYHNLLGWPDGVSGLQLRHLGTLHARRMGVEFLRTNVTAVVRADSGFRVSTSAGANIEARTMLLCTGVSDHVPPIPGIQPALGLTIYVCPDCDGYECRGKRTAVLGTGDAGANVALALRHWTNDIILINHAEEDSEVQGAVGEMENSAQRTGAAISAENRQALATANIAMVDANVDSVVLDAREAIEAIVLTNGDVVRAESEKRRKHPPYNPRPRGRVPSVTKNA